MFACPYGCVCVCVFCSFLCHTAHWQFVFRVYGGVQSGNSHSTILPTHSFLWLPQMHGDDEDCGGYVFAGVVLEFWEWIFQRRWFGCWLKWHAVKWRERKELNFMYFFFFEAWLRRDLSGEWSEIFLFLSHSPGRQLFFTFVVRHHVKYVSFRLSRSVSLRIFYTRKFCIVILVSWEGFVHPEPINKGLIALQVMLERTVSQKLMSKFKNRR